MPDRKKRGCVSLGIGGAAAPAEGGADHEEPALYFHPHQASGPLRDAFDLAVRRGYESMQSPSAISLWFDAVQPPSDMTSDADHSAAHWRRIVTRTYQLVYADGQCMFRDMAAAIPEQSAQLLGTRLAGGHMQARAIDLARELAVLCNVVVGSTQTHNAVMSATTLEVAQEAYAAQAAVNSQAICRALRMINSLYQTAAFADESQP